MEAASYWLAGPDHKAAGCGTPGGPNASAGSLMGRPSSGVGGCRARVPDLVLVCWGCFLTQLAMGSRVSQSWCWPTDEWGPRDPGVAGWGVPCIS